MLSRDHICLIIMDRIQRVRREIQEKHELKYDERIRSQKLQSIKSATVLSVGGEVKQIVYK